MRELSGRVPDKTPRIDNAIAAVVTYVDGLTVPSPTGRNAHRRAALGVAWVFWIRAGRLFRENTATAIGL